MSKRDAALAWAARGFRVFPIKANAKSPPLVEPFYEKASSDPAQIRQWWTDLYGNELDHNIGVDTTGFVVVDLDNKQGKNGVEAYQAIGGNFDTLIVRTPSGGLHCYYRTEKSYGNTQGDRSGVAPGIDTRGHHGYVLGPGSVVGGGTYAVARDTAVRHIGGAVVARLDQIEQQRAARRSSGVEVGEDSAAAFATQYLLDRAPVAIQGAGGDETTYRVACAVRDFGVDEAAALDLLLEHWNERCEPPWQPEELRGKVVNAYRYGQNAGAVRHPATSFADVKIPAPEYVEREPAPASVAAAAGEFGNLIPQAALGRRPWIFKNMLLYGDVTTLIAPGGVGKSQASLMIAICLATGKDFLRYGNEVGPRKSIIYNAEETLAEMSMRVHAQCAVMGIDPATVAPMVKLVSGRDHGRFKISKGGARSPITVEKETCDAIIAAAQPDDVAMLVLDPLVNLHEAPENDNTAMRVVLEICEMLATIAHVGLLIPQHTAKPQLANANGYAGSADAGRGASSVRDAARASFTLMGPTDKDKEEFGLRPEEMRSYLRFDDAKANKSLASDRSSWLQKEGVTLLSGEIVGAFKPIDLHSRANLLREKLATILASAMRAWSTGSITVEQGAEALKAGWPMLADLDKRAIKARIERTLADPVIIEDGSTLRISATDTGRRIVIE